MSHFVIEVNVREVEHDTKTVPGPGRGTHNERTERIVNEVTRVVTREETKEKAILKAKAILDVS